MGCIWFPGLILQTLGLDQWSSHFGMHQNYLESFLKTECHLQSALLRRCRAELENLHTYQVPSADASDQGTALESHWANGKK